MSGCDLDLTLAYCWTVGPAWEGIPTLLALGMGFLVMRRARRRP